MEKALKVFSIGYIFALIAIFLLAMALAYFFDYEPSAGLGMVASFTGALWAGQKYAMDRKEVPPSAFSWQFALFSFVPALILSGIAAGIVALVVGPMALMADLATIPISFWWIGLALSAIFHILAARFFFSFGAKNQLKAKP